MRIGYAITPRDINAFMWSEDFNEFAKCPECGFRTDFSRTNPNFILRRRTPDFFVTYDFQYVVSERFREFAERNRLGGANFYPFKVDRGHFHFGVIRSLVVDQLRSCVQSSGLCATCGNYREVIAKGKSIWLEDAPKYLGFYQTNLFFGSKNRKFPIYIVNEATKEVLDGSGLTGFLDFEEVFGEVAAPAIKIPTVQILNDRAGVESVLETRLLLSLSIDSTPGFLCENQRFPGESRPIRVEYRLLAPASEKEIAMAGKLLAGMSGQILELYRLHNGVELYAQPKTDNIGVRLAPISEWKGLTKEARNFLVKGVRHPKFVAVGEVPESGNYFVVPLSGEYSGTIGLIDHETGSVEPFADGLNHFLRMASEEPVSFLMDTLGGYIRYSAEGSDDWIPEKYLPDIRDGSEGDRD